MNAAPYRLPRIVSAPVCDGAADGSAISGAALLGASAALAATLPLVQQGRRVALLCRDRYFFAAGLLAAWRAGMPVVLPPAFTERAVAKTLAADGVTAFFHDLDRQDGIRVPDVLAGSDPENGEAVLLTPEQPLLTLYTSGSSGAHQASDKTAAQLLGEAQLLLKLFALEPGFTLVSTVPSQHIYGLLFGVLLPLLGGGAFLRETPLYPETIQDRLSQMAGDVLVTVPAHLPGLSHLPEGALAGLKRVFCSTAPLDETVARAFRDRHGLAVTEVFGSTETGGMAWREQPPEQSWKPFPGLEIRAGAGGRLLLDSPLLAVGEARPFASQDRIEFLQPDRFRHLGRLDDVVKIGGKRVSLGHVETALLAIEGVQDATVLHRPRRGGRNAELLAAVAAPGRTAADIRAALAATFDSTLLPRRIRVLDRLPRGESGKLPMAEKIALFAVPAAAAPEVGTPGTGSPAPSRIPPHTGPIALAGGGVRFDITIPETLTYFEGHFPGFPILPGVSQLHEMVLPQVRALRPDWGEPKRLVRLKFQSPVAPGDELQLILEFDDARQRVVFRTLRGEVTCSSGRLWFQP